MVEKKGMNPSSGEEREEKNGGARAGKMEMARLESPTGSKDEHLVPVGITSRD